MLQKRNLVVIICDFLIFIKKKLISISDLYLNPVYSMGIERDSNEESLPIKKRRDKKEETQKRKTKTQKK